MRKGHSALSYLILVILKPVHIIPAANKTIPTVLTICCKGPKRGPSPNKGAPRMNNWIPKFGSLSTNRQANPIRR